MMSIDEIERAGLFERLLVVLDRIAEVLRTAKAVVMVTHDMSWITAFCNRAVLMDKGKIVADGDPEEIADLHEQDAAKRAKQKRKAKQLLKHGKVELVDIKKARKEGKLDELVEEAADAPQPAEAVPAACAADPAHSLSWDETLGIIDEVVAEPASGAHRKPKVAADALRQALTRQLGDLRAMDAEALVAQRYQRFRALGAWS
mgnify:CR=1 FL=1